MRAAAARFGVPGEEIDAMLMHATSEAHVIAAGRALARLERERSGMRG